MVVFGFSGSFPLRQASRPQRDGRLLSVVRLQRDAGVMGRIPGVADEDVRNGMSRTGITITGLQKPFIFHDRPAGNRVVISSPKTKTLQTCPSV